MVAITYACPNCHQHSSHADGCPRSAADTCAYVHERVGIRCGGNRVNHDLQYADHEFKEFADASPVPTRIAKHPFEPMPNDPVTCRVCGQMPSNEAHANVPLAALDTEGEMEANAIAQECQRRMDAVVEAAVEWHQSGQEGDGSWFDKSEALSRAIGSLLDLRSAAECFCGTELEAGLCPNGTQVARFCPKAKCNHLSRPR